MLNKMAVVTIKCYYTQIFQSLYNSFSILGFDIPHDVFGEETLQSSELKVYWKPKLSIKRAHGSFRASVHDVLKLQKPHMTMVVDTKVCFTLLRFRFLQWGAPRCA